MKTSTDILREHFEQLKNAVPEIYAASEKSPEVTQDQKLFEVVKRTLRIIEAVYFQNKEMFTVTRADEYQRIVSDLKDLGYSYVANEELLEKAATAALMKSKLPMEKAGGKSAGSSSKEAV